MVIKSGIDQDIIERMAEDETPKIVVVEAQVTGSYTYECGTFTCYITH